MEIVNQEVISMLKGNEYLPIKIEEDIETAAQVEFFSSKVKKRDLAVFCRQFLYYVRCWNRNS